MKIFNYGVIALLLLVSGPGLRADDNCKDGYAHSANPFEPTVSVEEAKLINTAMEQAKIDKHAAIKLLQIKNLDEASSAIDFTIGNMYFQLNELDEAASAYENAVIKQPKFRSAIKNLGRVYLLQGKADKAIEVYQQLVADGQADADILILLGHTLLLEDYPVSAEVAYRQSLLLLPKNPDAMLGMAKSLIMQERYLQGLSLIKEILQGNPVQKELWALQANAYLAMGDELQTIRTIEVAKRLGCADAEMMANLGDLYLNSEKPEDAIDAYTIAFSSKDPSLPRMLRAVEGFVMTGDSDQAEKMVATVEQMQTNKKVNLDPKSESKLLRLKGELAQQNGDLQGAMAIYEQLLKIDPLDGKTMLLLAKGYQFNNDYEQAVIYCERAARIQGFEAEALVLNAQIDVEREEYAHAADLLEASLAFSDKANVRRYLEQVRRMIN